MAARLTRAKKRLASSGIPFATPTRGPPGRAPRRRRDRRLPGLHVRLPPRRRRRPAARRPRRRGHPAAARPRLPAARPPRGPRAARPPAPAALPPRHPPRPRRRARPAARPGPLPLAPRRDRRGRRPPRVPAASPGTDRPSTAGPRRPRHPVRRHPPRRGVPPPGADRRRARHRPDGRRHPLGRHRRPVPPARAPHRLAGRPPGPRGRGRGGRPVPSAGLLLLDGLEDALPRHHRVPAVRAELLVRAGNPTAAATAYREALTLVTNPTERTHLESRLAALTSPPTLTDHAVEIVRPSPRSCSLQLTISAETHVLATADRRPTTARSPGRPPTVVRLSRTVGDTLDVMSRRPNADASIEPPADASRRSALARDHPAPRCGRGCRSGEWERVGRGVYMPTPPSSDLASGRRWPRAHHRACTSGSQAPHWFSHESAALDLGPPAVDGRRDRRTSTRSIAERLAPSDPAVTATRHAWIRASSPSSTGCRSRLSNAPSSTAHRRCAPLEAWSSPTRRCARVPTPELVASIAGDATPDAAASRGRAPSSGSPTTARSRLVSRLPGSSCSRDGLPAPSTQIPRRDPPRHVLGRPRLGGVAAAARVRRPGEVRRRSRAEAFIREKRRHDASWRPAGGRSA